MDSRTPGAIGGLWRNRDTGELVRWVRWVELEEDPEKPSLFSAFRSNPEEYKAKGLPLSDIIYEDRARLLFIPRAPRFGIKATTARELYDSLDDARKALVQFIEPPPILIRREHTMIHECEIRTCHKPAWFIVSDEKEIEPQIDSEGRQHERAILLRPHWFCVAHFRLPTIVSRRGVQSEVNIPEGEAGRPA
jgi:hypothetical protein